MEMGIGGRFCIPSLGLNKAGGKPTKTGFGSTDFVNQISVASGHPVRLLTTVLRVLRIQSRPNFKYYIRSFLLCY
jgi:hypothetical protein